MAVPVLNFQEFIGADGERLTTTSLKVAGAFGKPHRSVLRKFDTLECSLEFRLLNFVQTVEYRLNPSGGADIPSRVIHMTKDGFVFLVMGFTGAKAAGFKEAYINAFNAMAALIKNQREGLAFRAAKHQLEFKNSADRGTFHGRGLYQRKLEKPLLEAEGRELEALMQPCLFAEAPELLQ